MRHNRIVSVLYCLAMSKRNLKTAKPVQLTTTNNRLPYHQPAVYYLGSIEKLQANYSGEALDGPDNGYYYNP